MGTRKIRVLVIDDSAFNRRGLVEMLESAEDVAVVGTAADGEEGLKLALALNPDVITLDLEMPRVDGFTFLRLLRAKTAIPVIVVSGYARSADVFKALELGAMDFVAKPARHFSKETEAVRAELVAKIGAVRHLKRPGAAPQPGGALRVAVIGASTGGPPALQRLLSSLPGELELAVVVAQHMPERFTLTFAERLDRASAFDVAEARAGVELAAGKALIAPGGRHLRLVREGERLRVALSDAAARDKYVPSIDQLFSSAAEVGRGAVLGVLLTGMGSDGRDGMLSLKRSGAPTVAESEESAVIFGMPREAILAGAAGRVLPLDAIIAQVIEFGRGQGGAAPAR